MKNLLSIFLVNLSLLSISGLSYAQVEDEKSLLNYLNLESARVRSVIQKSRESQLQAILSYLKAQNKGTGPISQALESCKQHSDQTQYCSSRDNDVVLSLPQKQAMVIRAKGSEISIWKSNIAEGEMNYDELSRFCKKDGFQIPSFEQIEQLVKSDIALVTAVMTGMSAKENLWHFGSGVEGLIVFNSSKIGSTMKLGGGSHRVKSMCVRTVKYQELLRPNQEQCPQSEPLDFFNFQNPDPTIDQGKAGQPKAKSNSSLYDE